VKEGWKGVRPLRFREEIFDVLEMMARKDMGTSIEEITNDLLRLRLAREDRRLKALQKSVSLENTRRKKPKMLTKAEQMIRVFRRTALITKEDGLFWLTPAGRQLIIVKQRDEIGADALFIKHLVNSPFHAYWLFLKQLFKHGELSIPSSFSERDNRLRDYILSQGFLLDMWSFFILRDLFYDFSLLNYIIDTVSQKIFPLYAIEHEMPSHSYQYTIKGPDAILSFWPKMPEDFLENIAKVYLYITGNKWNRMVDFMTLREKYSERFLTPERQFDILLNQAMDQKSRYDIVLSVGQLDIGTRSSYITKALSLPCNKFGLPYTLIRIGVGDG